MPSPNRFIPTFVTVNRKWLSRGLLSSKIVSSLRSAKARSKRRSIHAPNLTDELSTAEERRLNQFGSAD